MQSKLTDVLVSYLCPTCDTRVQTSFLLVEPEQSSKQASKSHWCKRCESGHDITYRLRRKRNGDLNLQIIEFLSDGMKFKKYFKILEQPGAQRKPRRKR